MLKLALHGPLKSGKSSLAQALQERGFQYLNYTDLLKQLLCEALASIGVNLTVEEIHANKEKYRQLIIEFASVAGFDDGFGIDRMLAEIKPDATGVVFDNVRFLPQWKLLKAEGFILVRLTTSERIRLARARSEGMQRSIFEALATLDTEKPLPPQDGEITLNVAGNMETVIDELTAQVVSRAQTAWTLDTPAPVVVTPPVKLVATATEKPAEKTAKKAK